MPPPSRLEPNYAAVLDVVPEARPGELLPLLNRAAEPLGARGLCVYLADYQGVVLLPVLVDESVDEAHEDVAGSMAGRAYRTGQVSTAQRDDGVRVWIPLIERGERTGVLAMTLSAVSDEALDHCVRLGRFAGILVRSFSRTTDILHLARRRRSMTLAASMQWDLLPPLTLNSAHASVSGRLEPAYEIAGDAFDYAMNEEYLHLALFDGMGHGMHSMLMTALAVGAYRHARRNGSTIGEIYYEADQVLAEQYRDRYYFVTAAFAQLSVDDGRLEWSVAGHPAPLLLRGNRVVRQLSCRPSIPLGLGGEFQELAADQLEPGDCLLFFTDGVTEGRSESGEQFGVESLIERWEHHAAADFEPDETLRRLVEDVMAHSAGKLRDDASLVILRWNGPPK